MARQLPGEAGRGGCLPAGAHPSAYSGEQDHRRFWSQRLLRSQLILPLAAYITSGRRLSCGLSPLSCSGSPGSALRDNPAPSKKMGSTSFTFCLLYFPWIVFNSCLIGLAQTSPQFPSVIKWGDDCAQHLTHPNICLTPPLPFSDYLPWVPNCSHLSFSLPTLTETCLSLPPAPPESIRLTRKLPEGQ